MLLFFFHALIVRMPNRYKFVCILCWTAIFLQMESRKILTLLWTPCLKKTLIMSVVQKSPNFLTFWNFFVNVNARVTPLFNESPDTRNSFRQVYIYLDFSYAIIIWASYSLPVLIMDYMLTNILERKQIQEIKVIFFFIYS